MRFTVTTVSLLLACVLGLTAAGPRAADGGDEMANAFPDRAVLEGVPRVGKYPLQSTSAPEDHSFPACLRGCLEYLKDDIHADWLGAHSSDWHGVHEYLMGQSGIAWQLTWGPGRWGGGTWEVLNMAADPLEPIRRAFESVGYECEIVTRGGVARSLGLTQPGCDDESAWRERIIASIRRGRPAIALGVMGIPHEWCLITGYDAGGEAVIGWPFYHGSDEEPRKYGAEPDPSGYFRKSDWFADSRVLVVLGDKGERPHKREAYRRGLEWGLRVVRTPEVRGRASGQAAYDPWLADLVRHADFIGAAPDVVNERDRLTGGTGGHLAEARCWGASFLRQAASGEPAVAAELDAAATCWLAIHDLVWRLWQTGGEGGEETAPRFAQSAMRRELARIVGLFEEEDAEAASHIERALLIMEVPRERIPPASAREQASAGRAVARRQASGGERANFRSAGTTGTWVDGVPALSWSGETDCTVVGALAAALAPTRHPYSYTDLMGYSGLAFRTRWFDNPPRAQTEWGAMRWHPVSPHGEQPEEIAAIARATGWMLRREELPADPNDVDRARLVTDIVVSVNAGLPAVVGYNTDLAVAYGYHIWSANLFLRDYQRPGQLNVRVPSSDAKLESPFIFLDRRGEPLPNRDAFLEALRIAVRNGRRGPTGPFQHGLAALAAWRDAIASCDVHSREERKLLFDVNWWSLMHLADARRAAVNFLASHEGLLSGDSRTALQAALDLYREESSLLASFADAHRRFIVWKRGDAGAADWSADVRSGQVDLLKQALDLEEQALGALETVLALEASR